MAGPFRNLARRNQAHKVIPIRSKNLLNTSVLSYLRPYATNFIRFLLIFIDFTSKPSLGSEVSRQQGFGAARYRAARYRAARYGSSEVVH